MSERYRVAVVGGGIGKSHVASYRKLPEYYDIVAVCDVNAARGRDLAELAGTERIATDLAQVCALADVDIVDLCTPPFLHFDQVKQVLAARKHVVCEKPLVGSLREVDDLVAAETAAGKRVLPIFQYRFGHGLQKLKYLQQTGLTGPAYVTNVEVSWRRRAEYYAVPWRGKWATELGGALTGHAIHSLDMLTYAVGPVRNVFARAKTMVNAIEVEDCAAISFEMADGSLATLSVTLGSPVEVTRHRFCFSKLVAETNTRPYSNSGEPWTFSGDTPELQQQIDAALARFVPMPEHYEGQFLRNYEALQMGGQPPVTLADARADIELLTAIYRSSRTGQPVTLPLGKDEWYDGWSLR